MKILVTGGAGYIGSHTARVLLKSGYEVVIIDNLCNGHVESIPEGVKFCNIDLCNKDALAKVFAEDRFDAVMHFASFIEVGHSMKDPVAFYRNNILSSINLLQVMKDFKVKRIVFSSSAAVYGNIGDGKVSEDFNPEPINAYGRSKLIIENMLSDADLAYGIKSISLRYFNAAGAAFGIGEHHEPESHLIPLVLKTIMGEREHIAVYGDDYDTRDGTCIRDYVHILDLAEAHKLALGKLDTSRVYNLGNGDGYSVLDVIAMAKGVTGNDFKVKLEARRPGDPPILIADSSRARKELGWSPRYGMKEIIASAWEWHKDNPSGYSK